MFADKDVTCKRCLNLYNAHLAKSENEIQINAHLLKAKAQFLSKPYFQALLGGCCVLQSPSTPTNRYEKKTFTFH